MYNKKPGQKTQDNAGSKSLVQRIGISLFGKKHKMFSVKTVIGLHRITPTDFQIILKPEPKVDDVKALKYRAYHPDDCSQVMAKLNFLLT